MKKYVFWVQTERWETERKSMSVPELKAFVKVGSSYSCRQEKPSKAEFSNLQSVDLTCEPHFVFVPPAHY